ncbi:hypothetical protein BvCms40BK_02538 [Escherichia coli]|nr:hypothetical protein BvCms40BK_02538 [Escherichia coli]
MMSNVKKKDVPLISISLVLRDPLIISPKRNHV